MIMRIILFKKGILIILTQYEIINKKEKKSELALYLKDKIVLEDKLKKEKK